MSQLSKLGYKICVPAESVAQQETVLVLERQTARIRIMEIELSQVGLIEVPEK
jgi:hypothetical protein